MTHVKQTEQLVFRCYLPGRIATNFGLLLLIFVCWLDVYVYTTYHGSDVAKGRIWAPFLTILGLNNIMLWICGGDTHLDDNGISRWRWGKRWQFIAWKDVKIATLESFLDNTMKDPHQTMVTIFKTETVRWIDAQLHGLRFGTDVRNGELLVDTILQRLREHNVRIIDKRKR